MIPTILVTGPNGQLGFELVRTLACVGRVQTVGRNDVDLSDFDAVRRHVRALRPDIIVNAAAYTNVDRAESEHLLAERINGELPQVLAGELRQYGGQLMVHYSTDYVFDGSATQPWREDAPTSPLNAYGRSKLLGEQALQRSGVPHLVLRTSWIFATRGSNFLLTILRLAREGKPLRIISDQVGAPTWARILAETTALMIPLWLKFSQAERAAASGVYHATAAGQTTWHGFTEQILQEYLCRLRATNSLSDWCAGALQTLTPISSAEYPSVARRPQYSVLSNDKLERVFGLRLPDWRDQLRLALADYLNPADLTT